MGEDGDQDNDRDRHSEQPKKNRLAHDFSFRGVGQCLTVPQPAIPRSIPQTASLCCGKTRREGSDQKGYSQP
jgi:hypothetical protein